VKNVTGQYRGGQQQKGSREEHALPKEGNTEPRHDRYLRGEGMETVTDRPRFPATLPIKDLADTIFP
jgi:hypothetical protein